MLHVINIYLYAFPGDLCSCTEGKRVEKQG